MPKTMPKTIKYSRGTSVRWPPAPLGFAEVVELRRTCVRLYYITKSGRERQPIVSASRVEEIQRHPGDDHQLPLPLFNFFNRAFVPRKECSDV